MSTNQLNGHNGTFVRAVEPVASEGYAGEFSPETDGEESTGHEAPPVETNRIAETTILDVSHDEPIFTEGASVSDITTVVIDPGTDTTWAYGLSADGKVIASVGPFHSVGTEKIGKKKRFQDEPQFEYIFGTRALQFDGRDIKNASKTTWPIQGGLAKNVDMAGRLIQHTVGLVQGKRVLPFGIEKKRRIKLLLVSIPEGCTTDDTKNHRDLVRPKIQELINPEELLFVPQPLAALAGEGYDIEGPKTCGVIDSGGGTTQISFYRFGKATPDSKTINTAAGKVVDREIKSRIERDHFIRITEETARQIKLAVSTGCNQPGAKLLNHHVFFTGGKSGAIEGLTQCDLPVDNIVAILARVIVTMDDAIYDAMTGICRNDLQGLEDVLQNSQGFLVCGGNSQIKGFAYKIQYRLGDAAKLNRVSNPQASVSKGLIKMAGMNIDVLRSMSIK